ncbi:MAG: hypothetical protein R3Y47_01095 [Lachnospiraceae bacterium]
MKEKILKNLIREINNKGDIELENASNYIELVLIYRSRKYLREIDSSDYVKAFWEELYEDIPERADTILNVVNPLKAFSIYRLKQLGGNKYPFVQINGNWRLKKELFRIILENLNGIFNGFSELRELFERLSEIAYSLANFMPAPIGYNGTSVSFGKGSYHENNDYPFFYYMNLLDGKDDKSLKWLNSVWELYDIQELFEIRPPFLDPDYYFELKDYNELERYLRQCIEGIENRAQLLEERMNNSK